MNTGISMTDASLSIQVFARLQKIIHKEELFYMKWVIVDRLTRVRLMSLSEGGSNVQNFL